MSSQSLTAIVVCSTVVRGLKNQRTSSYQGPHSEKMTIYAEKQLAVIIVINTRRCYTLTL